MRALGRIVLVAGLGGFAFGLPGEAAQCGSGVLLETALPAVFQGIGLGPDAVARFWGEGSASSSFEALACEVGCQDLGAGAVALAGINWLNASCAVAGAVPTRTVFLLERTTAGAGGQWAALNLDRGPGDFNIALDAKAQAVCGDCSSSGSPYLGGSAVPLVGNVTRSGDDLTVALSWSQPAAAAQALSNGANLVRSYSVYYQRSAPANSGDKTGWTLLADADAGQLGGYSTNTQASVTVPLLASAQDVYLAVGLNFDGTGNPQADANTIESAYLSAASVPVCLGTTAAVEGSRELCTGEEATIRVDLAGAGPWNLTWSDGVVQSAVVNSPAQRTVSPTATTTYSLTSISDAQCAGVVSGSALVTFDPDPNCGSFFTLAPCRVVDTRNAAGPLGGPAMTSGTSRSFPMASASCGVPLSAKALALNATVSDASSAGECLLYPGDVATPEASTLSYPPSTARAGQAVVRIPVGTASLGARCVQASGTVHLIIDVVGYFL